MAIFSLKQVKTEQVKNYSSNTFDYWSENNGSNGYSYTNTTSFSSINIKRLDFTTETSYGLSLSTGLNFSTSNDGSANFPSGKYGYSCGNVNISISLPGTPAPPTTTNSSLTRLDFSNETATVPGSVTTIGKGQSGSTSDGSLYGYQVTGQVDSPSTTTRFNTTIVRLDFSNESFASLPADFPLATQSRSSGNSKTYGYFFGGINPEGGTNFNNIWRYDLSTNNLTTLSSVCEQSGYAKYIISDPTKKYFYAGVYDSSGNVSYLSTRLDTSTETVNAVLAPSQAMVGGVCGHSSDTYGYISTSSSPFIPAKSEKMDFSNETFSTFYATVRSLQTTQNGTSFLPSSSKSFFIQNDPYLRELEKSQTSAYFVGATRAAFSTYSGNIRKYDFQTSLIVGESTTTFSMAYSAASLSSEYVYYTVATTGNATYSSLGRLEFASDTEIFSGAKLHADKYASSAISSKNYGYYGGGRTTPGIRYSNIDRLDHSLDIVSSIPSRLSHEKSNLTSTSDRSSYGYYAGGITPVSNISSIERLDFSTETITLRSSNLSQAKSFLAASSSKFYAYFGGGFDGTNRFSTIDRMDFSTETITTPSVKLEANKSDLSSASDRENAAYFGHGASASVPAPASSYNSNIYRLDFSNESFVVDSSDANEFSDRVGTVGVSH